MDENKNVAVSSLLEINKETPEVKEGFARMTFLCQVEKVKVSDLGV